MFPHVDYHLHAQFHTLTLQWGKFMVQHPAKGALMLGMLDSGSHVEDKWECVLHSGRAVV